MSTGLDVLECVSPAPASGTVLISGRSIACTASDGSAGAVSVIHLDLSPGANVPAFDYSQAAGFWGAAFCSVVALYMVSRGIGVVVDFIRRA
jgi:hypothetical protein